ncbi:MAG: hypothetical protein ABEH35_06430 [Haloarculaceae archaeon]
MGTAVISRWSRRFVAASALFLLAWQVALLADAGRRVGVTLGLLGLVLHTVFGKAYSLVPSYFDRDLAVPRAMVVHLPLSAGGVLALAGGFLVGSRPALIAGATLWCLGVVVFLGNLGWTLRDNLTGAETGTGEANADRATIDRYANAFVPVVFAYLAVGSYALLAATADLPTPVAGYAQISHLLAAGVGALLIFAVGFRLFPRFLVAHPPRALVAVVLPAGALGPAVIAGGLYDGRLLQVGAALEAVAVVGFAGAFLALFFRSDRRRVGFYAVAVAVLAGVVGVGLGVQFALAGRPAPLVSAHLRANLLGFLGLTIVGATMQFYPPTVGGQPGASDRTGLAAIATLAVGLAIQMAGLAAEAMGSGPAVVTTAGEALALAGAGLYAYLLLGAFLTRPT